MATPFEHLDQAERTLMANQTATGWAAIHEIRAARAGLLRFFAWLRWVFEATW